MNKINISLSILFIIFFQACAFDVMRAKQVPAELESASRCHHAFVLIKPAEVIPEGGYKRILKSGAKWTCVGNIQQGEVYMTRDHVLTVEASNIFEAYIVVSSGTIVGFYLPVEKTFTPIENPVKLVVSET